MNAAKPFNPLHLDVERFARDGATLEGAWPLGVLERLAESQAEGVAPVGRELHWRASGQRFERVGAPAEVWLHLGARTAVRLVCQRCLQAMEVPLEIDRSFRFVRNENEAAELDAQVEEDILVLSRSLDLRELVEDELLLALPLVPRHEDCRHPAAGLAEPPVTDEAPAERPHPFAALAALKRDLT
jgi:uncharacterized protein